MEEQQQEQEQQEQQPLFPTGEATPQEEEQGQTKSVKNFWERLDEVFNQNTQFKERMEELIDQFPSEQKVNTDIYRSYLFQPERISLCSNDDAALDVALANPGIPILDASGAVIINYPTTSQGHSEAERFSRFRIRLARPLRNVKSVQLLSCVIPNAIQNLPDDQVFFLYYRLRSIQQADKGQWLQTRAYLPGDIVSDEGDIYVVNTPVLPGGNSPLASLNYQQITIPPNINRPNYYDLNPYRIEYVFFLPTFSWPPEYQAANANLSSFFNRRYEDYDDLVTSLNIVAASANLNCSIQNDISFNYNQALNKIVFTPNPANVAAGYYYLPLGYADPNIAKFYKVQPISTSIEPGNFNYSYDFQPQTLMNPRLGFTWNGLFPNPFQSANPWTDKPLMGSLYWYLRSNDPYYIPSPLTPLQQNFLTFNNYPDLVNTSCVRVYADFAFSSTQDSLNSTAPLNQTTGGLLSIVPVNTTNLGVGFYQNNFSNPLTKIPQNLTEISINMLTDQGTPFYLPNSATVILELAIAYH